MDTFAALVIIVVGSILAFEARAWMPHLSRWLVAQAIRRLPGDLKIELRQRWAEEIRADLVAFDDRPVGGLIFALRVRLKGGRDLAAELALQQALQSEEDVAAEETKQQVEGSRAQPVVDFPWESLSLLALMNQLELFFKEIVSRDLDSRDVPLDDLRKLLRHARLRKAFDRFDPDLKTVEGMKIALVLRDLRKEVEGWDSHE
jgi:hypothetical protein